MVVEMHAFNITSEDEKKVFISYNLFYYRLAVLLYPRTSRPVLSRYLSREESRLTEHPVCTIYHQPLPDSTGGSDYWLWHLHERNGSLPRSHHRVLSCLLHIRNTVPLHIPVSYWGQIIEKIREESNLYIKWYRNIYKARRTEISK